MASMALALLLASGVALALNTIQCKPKATSCSGTAGRDLMKGTGGTDFMRGRAGADIVKGFGGTDLLDGAVGNDVLVGGNARDSLYGGRGDDTLKGGAGRDSYQQCMRWGNDEIVDTAEATPAHSLFNGNAFAVFHQCGISGEGMVIDLNSGPSPEAAQGTDTVNWSGDAIDDVFVSNDSGNDDRIVGNDAANFIVSGDDGGREYAEPSHVDSDTVLGNGGDDKINVQDASGDDIVSCGDGNDTVFFDPGDTLVDPDACEEQDDSLPPYEGL